MKAFVLVAHGSRNQESNKEVEFFFDRISSMIKNNFMDRRFSFLEFGKPSFQDVIKELCLKNPESITIFPYFLMNGTHVKKDIPEIIESFSQEFNNIKFKLLSGLIEIDGMDKFLSDFIIKKAN